MDDYISREAAIKESIDSMATLTMTWNGDCTMR